MRVLLINYEYPPIGAGAANATAYIARAMARLGHHPVVLTAAYADLPRRSEEDGIEVLRVAARRARADRSNLFEMATFVASAALALPSVIRSRKPDGAIVFFSMPCGPLGLLGRWFANLPYVVSLRGGDVPGTEPGLSRVYTLLGPIRRLVLRKALAVVANSSGLKELSEAADPVGVLVIPNGVDTEHFRVSATDSVRPFTFLFVGRFQKQKNLPLLLNAIAALRCQTDQRFRVVLVGDGPLRELLETTAAELGLGDVVSWHGWCRKQELLTRYQEADCFLNPSEYEGMPNTVLEAMACGLPVIASAVPGNDAVVSPHETGLLFESGSSGELVAAMSWMLGDPARARALGHAGRKRVEREFSWPRVAEGYVGLLAGRATGAEGQDQVTKGPPDPLESTAR